ncbi:hypothetical protein [Psychrobacter lutiphocae]|uniref:hypothetical protein n=1 Tax=Psychrobacter lutiphocae TaxID=540500 RepID=UPI0003813C1B|nr:hypothetical protein [Psychrobacter lutiphocae]
MNMKEIIGIEVDYSQLPRDRNTSMHPEAVKYRRALARASNAIEGVILTEEDKKFLDSIPNNLSKEKIKKLVLKNIHSRSK